MNVFEDDVALVAHPKSSDGWLVLFALVSYMVGSMYPKSLTVALLLGFFVWATENLTLNSAGSL